MVKIFYFLLFAFLLLPVGIIAQNDSKEHFYIISDNLDDSLYCAKHYPYYDFENESIVYGIMTPEKLIQGKDLPLIDIFLDVKNHLLKHYNTLEEGKILSISILVDNNGIVRGGVTNYDLKQEYTIMRYVFEQFKGYNYIPAYVRGKPITFCFSFIVKIP